MNLKHAINLNWKSKSHKGISNEHGVKVKCFVTIDCQMKTQRDTRKHIVLFLFFNPLKKI